MLRVFVLSIKPHLGQTFICDSTLWTHRGHGKLHLLVNVGGAEFRVTEVLTGAERELTMEIRVDDALFWSQEGDDTLERWKKLSEVECDFSPH